MFSCDSIRLSPNWFIQFCAEGALVRPPDCTGALAKLGDNLMLSQLNIPGTHESCAHATYVHDWADCQDWSLQDQLNHGIRYIDIRCRHINDGFDLYHGDVQIVSSLYSNAGLKFAADVRDVCVAFLKANPKECIIMQIKRESSDSNNTQTFEDPQFVGWAKQNVPNTLGTKILTSYPA